jgi:23S rRNA (pseudouridine1915-N3)-methyltransferase
MKIEFIYIGKTTDSYLKEGIALYKKRLANYIGCEEITLNSSASKIREKVIAEESAIILSKIAPRDFVVLLDERGKEYTSRELAGFIQHCMNKGYNRLLMITGGAFGVSEELKAKADITLSASRFTFTHQMIRLIMMEQVYRAMTILKNESYHHD